MIPHRSRLLRLGYGPGLRQGPADKTRRLLVRRGGERMLFEIRIVNGQWCLDSFAIAAGHSRALLNCEKLHPFGPWYRVTAVYDGKMLHNYVGDEIQGEGELVIPPERPGRSSVGTRIDLRDYYKGAMYSARFTRRALPVGDFLKLPKAK